MALTKGVNSHVAMDEAQLYFDNRLDVSAWVEASTVEKEQALTTATAMMEYMPWVGKMASVDQPLVWPRIGAYYDPRTGTVIDLATVPLPSRVAQGQCELAHHLLENDGALDTTGSLEELHVSSIVLKGVIKVSTIPTSVSNILAPLLTESLPSPKVGGRWWRDN